LSVPWNTPATGYKPSPSVGVQYTLSPATRTVYTTSYSLSPQELTNKLIHYENRQQNNKNPADTSPKSNALYLTSDKVPDIHNIILAKMKHNRRRAKQKHAKMQSPVVVPSPSKPDKYMCQHNNNNNSEGEDDIQDEQDPDIELEEVFQGEGESVSSVGSVASSRSTSRCNSQDERITDEALETNFRTLFEEVDFCHSGTVSSQRLLGRIMELMCVNPDEKWRIDEFSRLIDPRHDDRFVDVEQFVQVGKTWIENMFEREMRNDKLSIGDDRTITGRKMSTSWCQQHQELLEEDDYLENNDLRSNLNQSINASFSAGRRITDNLANASFGSVEGYGGDQGCYSREVDLENRCSELRYQLYRQQEEYQDLRRTLASTEDMAGHLSSQLDSAKARISGLTAELDRLSCSSHDAEEHLVAGRQAQNKCRSLALELEQLKDALSYKDSLLRDRDEQLVKLKQEVDSTTEKEQFAAVKLLHREAELAAVTEQLQKEMSRREELGQALAAMEMDKLKSEDEVSKLQQQIVIKDVELKDIRNLSQGIAVLGNQSIQIHGSNVLDVSVDDKVFEDMSGSQSPTPRKGGGIAMSPHPQRFHGQGGPSASSTPCREKRGSLVDELKEAVGSAPDQFPSPLCGKGAGTLASKLQREILKWENAMRRAVIEEAPSACSGKLVTTLNKTMQSVRKDVITKVETFEEEVWEKEEEMKRKLLDLRAELDAANQQINQQSINKELEYEEEKELELVESRLTEMAQLLNTANKALLATTNQGDHEGGGGTKTPVSNEVSYDEDLLTHWNLDLDGLELVEWNNNLSRKLMQYTKHIREEKRAGTPSSKLWLSLLHSKLDELHTETEKSRELLLFAGESIREDVYHLPQSSLADQSRPRPTITINDEADGVRRSLQITEVESRGVQTCPPDVRSVQTEMVGLSAPTFPKTQSCQTSLMEDKKEVTTQNEDDMKTDEANETRGGGVLTWLRNLVGVTLLVVLIFTACGGLEFDGRIYYPITYRPLRFLDWVPTPRVSLQYVRHPLIW